MKASTAMKVVCGDDLLKQLCSTVEMVLCADVACVVNLECFVYILQGQRLLQCHVESLHESSNATVVLGRLYIK